jgi:hypothetical protein
MTDYTPPAVVISYYIPDMYKAADGFQSGGTADTTDGGRDFCATYPKKC